MPSMQFGVSFLEGFVEFFVVSTCIISSLLGHCSVWLLCKYWGFILVPLGDEC